MESSTQKMLGIVAFVYMIPVALFMAGYLLTAFLTASVALQYTVAVAAFLVGIGFAVLYDRRLRAKGGLTFTIVRLF